MALALMGERRLGSAQGPESRLPRQGPTHSFRNLPPSVGLLAGCGPPLPEMGHAVAPSSTDLADIRPTGRTAARPPHISRNLLYYITLSIIVSYAMPLRPVDRNDSLLNLSHRPTSSCEVGRWLVGER
jgi:hypothetical protein